MISRKVFGNQEAGICSRFLSAAFGCPYAMLGIIKKGTEGQSSSINF